MILGIEPSIDGGVVLLNDKPDVAGFAKLATHYARRLGWNLRGLAMMMKELENLTLTMAGYPSNRAPIECCYIERPRVRRGAARELPESSGAWYALQMWLTIREIRCVRVLPEQWQKGLGVKGRTARSREKRAGTVFTKLLPNPSLQWMRPPHHRGLVVATLVAEYGRRSLLCC